MFIWAIRAHGWHWTTTWGSPLGRISFPEWKRELKTAGEGGHPRDSARVRRIYHPGEEELDMQEVAVKGRGISIFLAFRSEPRHSVDIAMKIFSDNDKQSESIVAGPSHPAAAPSSSPAPERMSSSQPVSSEERTNIVSARLSEEDKKAVQNALQTIRERLPFLKEFSAEERKGMMQLGKVGRTFIGRALDLVQNSPGVLPRSFDEEEFANDALLYAELGEIGDQLSELHRRVLDTEAAVGMDAFTAALVVYQAGKVAREGASMDGGLPGLERRLSREVKK